jgi:hypothetical protein
MTYFEAIKNLTATQLAKFLDQVYLTGFNAGYQSLVDHGIDDENPFSEEWVGSVVEGSPALVEDENGEPSIIGQLAVIVQRIAEFDMEQIPEDISWQSRIVLPKGTDGEERDDE